MTTNIGYDDRNTSKRSTSTTLRDEFAMAYLQGLVAYKGFYPLDAATECYKVADYMLAAREKK